MDKREILKRLKDAVGDDFASDSPSVLASYGYRNPVQPGAEMPDFAIVPGGTDDVKRVIDVANEYKISIVPAGVGMVSYNGSDGGIILDTYSRMNEIQEINAEDGYAVIGTGVTFGMLAHAIREHNCHFPFGSYPGSPSVITHMMRNSGAWTMFCQAGGNEIIALEAVLGNGEVVRTGYAGLDNPDWSSPNPHGIMPDLTDVFIHSQGTLGVVTRASVRIFDRNSERANPIGAFDNAWDGYRWVKKLSRAYMIEHGSIMDHNFVRWHRVNSESRSVQDASKRLSDLVRGQEHASDLPKDGMPRIIVPLMMSGLEDDIQSRLKCATKVSGEYGGRVLTAAEEKEFIGDYYRNTVWKGGFIEHIPMDPHAHGKFSLDIQGQRPNVFVGAASVLAKAEADMLAAFDDAGVTWAEYYLNPADQARNSYFNIGSMTDPLLSEEERVESDRRIVSALDAQGKRITEKYPVHLQDSWQLYWGKGRIIPGSMNLMRNIKNYCDPNGIMNPALSKPITGGN